MAKNNIDIVIRDTSDYGMIEEKIMNIFKKHELNYVEALGVIETLKICIDPIIQLMVMLIM